MLWYVMIELFEQDNVGIKVLDCEKNSRKETVRILNQLT